MESGFEPVQHSIESHRKATRPEQEGQFRDCWLPGEINEVPWYKLKEILGLRFVQLPLTLYLAFY